MTKSMAMSTSPRHAGGPAYGRAGQATLSSDAEDSQIQPEPESIPPPTHFNEVPEPEGLWPAPQLEDSRMSNLIDPTTNSVAPNLYPRTASRRSIRTDDRYRDLRDQITQFTRGVVKTYCIFFSSRTDGAPDSSADFATAILAHETAVTAWNKATEDDRQVKLTQVAATLAAVMDALNKLNESTEVPEEEKDQRDRGEETEGEVEEGHQAATIDASSPSTARETLVALRWSLDKIVDTISESTLAR